MPDLKLAPKLKLPLDIAGEAIGILAKRGAGKTNTGKVLVEELLDQHVQVVVLDPVGVWWGLRSDAAGGEGYPIAVLGGEHGDVPLEPAAGALIADVVVDEGQPLVLDVSEFSKTEQRRFVADFATRLYRRKARARTLLHVVLEEADEFAPQRVSAGDAPMVGAISLIVKRGRSRGLGLTFITQRSASLNKDVLDQADVLIAMRTIGPRDRKAIEGWIEHQDAAGADEVLPSLPSLDTGEAWLWNPERGMLERAQIRKAHTFDSSATPKAGAKKSEPRKVAPIDLDKLGTRIRETAERAKANDPRELHQTIRRLERELAQRSDHAPEKVVETVTERVEVPVLADAQISMLQAVARELRDTAAGVGEYADQITGAIATVTSESARVRAPRAAAPPPAPREQPRPRTPERPAARAATAVVGEEVRIGKGERKVMDVLREWPEGKTQNEVAFLAGYSAKASTIGVILSTLRRAGYVHDGQPIRLTDAGMDAAGGPIERATGPELLQEWLNHRRMGDGERKVLLELIERYPDEPTHDELCEATGYSPIASTMGVILSKLRKLGLVQKGRRLVDPAFYEAIR